MLVIVDLLEDLGEFFVVALLYDAVSVSYVGLIRLEGKVFIELGDYQISLRNMISETLDLVNLPLHMVIHFLSELDTVLLGGKDSEVSLYLSDPVHVDFR